MYVAPFLWMVFGSFKTQAELALNPPTWFPQAPTLNNYTNLFTKLNFPLYFTNSLLISVSHTLLTVLLCSMVGYALVKLKFVGRNMLFLLVVGTLMVPGSVTLIPVFILLTKLHLTNTLTGVVLPGVMSAFNIFLMRQFMLSIPDERPLLLLYDLTYRVKRFDLWLFSLVKLPEL